MSDHYDLVVLGAGPGGYVAAVRAAQLGLRTAIIELKYWGGVCNNVGCIPTKSLLRNAEVAHLFTHEAKTFGISGDVSFDFGVAFKRSRTVADRMAKGVHFLMKKNKVTEIDGWATFVDDHTFDVALNAGGNQQVTFDNLIIAAGATTRLLPGHLAQRAGRDVRGADPHRGAARVDHHRRVRRDRDRVRVRARQLRRRRDDRRVPRPDGPARGPGDLRRAAEAVQEAGREGADQHQGRGHRRLRRQGQGQRLAGQGRRHPDPRGRQGHAGDRVRAADRGLRPRQGRRPARRARGDRDRRPHAHERPAHLRDRRRHRQAPARPHRRGPGRRRRGDDRRRRDHARSTTT